MFIEVTGREQLEALIHDLRHWENAHNIQRESKQHLHRVAFEVEARLKAAVIATPSKQQNARRSRRSLRHAIARAVKSREMRSVVGGDAGIQVGPDPGSMPSGERGLPKLYEGVGEWHHPTYGHRPIVRQSPHPYFTQGTSRADNESERAGNKVIDTIADDIERGHP